MRTQWKDVEGYEGLYQVAANGDVRNAETGLVRKPQPNINTGYHQMRLTSRSTGVVTNHYIHRIVAAAFHGDSDLQVNHINGVKSDNSSDNLEYVTPSENIRHAQKLGLRP